MNTVHGLEEPSELETGTKEVPPLRTTPQYLRYPEWSTNTHRRCDYYNIWSGVVGAVAGLSSHPSMLNLVQPVLTVQEYYEMKSTSDTTSIPHPEEAFSQIELKQLDNCAAEWNIACYVLQQYWRLLEIFPYGDQTNFQGTPVEAMLIKLCEVARHAEHIIRGSEVLTAARIKETVNRIQLSVATTWVQKNAKKVV